MERVEDEVVSIGGPPMAGDDFSATADHNLVYISADQNVPVAYGHRDRIVIGPVSDQGQRTDPRRVLVAGVVRYGRQRQQLLQVPLQPFSYRLVVAAESIFEPSEAVLLQMSIEGIEALERWNGHQEVPADIADQTFYFALIVPFAWTAKPVLEQVVGLKLGEHPGPLPATISQDSGYRERGVVVEDALRHSAQEREGGDVSVAE